MMEFETFVFINSLIKILITILLNVYDIFVLETWNFNLFVKYIHSFKVNDY